MKKRFEDALQDCLEALATGRATAEECLARYRDLAGELGPLLRMGRRLQEVFSVDPSPLYAQAARRRFLASLPSRRQRAPTVRPGRTPSRQQRRLEPPASPRHRNGHRFTASTSRE